MSEKKTHARTITEFLLSRAAEGATDVEGAAATGIKEHVYRAQRIALEKKGTVCPTGERRDDGRKRHGQIYVLANFVSPEFLAEAQARRAERAERRAQAKAGIEAHHPAPKAAEIETPLGEQIDAGAEADFEDFASDESTEDDAEDPLFA